MFWFIVLLLVIGAGFYFYQKMMSIEREIRAEQESGNEHVAPVQKSEQPAADLSNLILSETESSLAPVIPEPTTLEAAVVSEVTKHPGIKQTDIYLLFADSGKKKVQKLIKDMADKGVLRREKQGSSYLLYLA